jgi:hypothetical protein
VRVRSTLPGLARYGSRLLKGRPLLANVRSGDPPVAGRGCHGQRLFCLSAPAPVTVLLVIILKCRCRWPLCTLEVATYGYVVRRSYGVYSRKSSTGPGPGLSRLPLYGSESLGGACHHEPGCPERAWQCARAFNVGVAHPPWGPRCKPDRPRPPAGPPHWQAGKTPLYIVGGQLASESTSP